jgi:hypothetical protein
LRWLVGVFTAGPQCAGRQCAVPSIDMYATKGAVRCLLLSAAAALASGCSSHSTPPPPEQSFKLTATIQELMNAQIDPAADALWDSVAFIATKAGVEERQPRTEEQWQAVRMSALTLMEAASLLSMPGRRVAADDREPGPGELRAAEIQSRIESSRGAFVQFARSLQEAGQKALTAIEAKDAQRLMDAGGVIDEACEACHVTYWYPDQNRPGT